LMIDWFTVGWLMLVG